MRRITLILAVFVVATALGASKTRAEAATYSYVGFHYNEVFNNILDPNIPSYNTAMNVKILFERDSRLPPNFPLSDISDSLQSYRFNDGINTLTDANSELEVFLVETDAAGNISFWSMSAKIFFPSLPAVGDIELGISSFSVSGGARDLGTIARCIQVTSGPCSLTRVNLGLLEDTPGIWSMQTSVAIDIVPGSNQNKINLGSAGIVPVAILSTESFDALEVNEDTIFLAGAGVKIAGKSGQGQCHVQDVNGDGLDDLVCHVETAEFMIQEGQDMAELTAETFDGMQVRGEDYIEIVP
jgi:hypothetical protein